MLESDYQGKLRLLLGSLQSTVTVPPAWADYFGQQGLLPASPDDRRRFARRYLREEAICELDQSLPAIARRHEFAKVYVKDYSRGGIAFLASRQLFPGEDLWLWTSQGKLPCSVVRCTKHHDRCFDVGAIVTAPKA
jgi:hypothetical protein